MAFDRSDITVRHTGWIMSGQLWFIRKIEDILAYRELRPSKINKMVISVRADGRSSRGIPCCKDNGDILVARANSCLMVLMAQQLVSAVVKELLVAYMPPSFPYDWLITDQI